MSFPTGWTKKCSLTINASQVSDADSANLSNFPVLLTEANFPSTAFDNTIDGGADLRFTSDEAGTTELAFEVVNWDTTNDKAEVWVKVPTVDYDDDTVFYVWYGNATATAYAVDATYGSQAVWSNGFQGVWHLQGNFNDSSPNGYNLTESVSAPTDTTDGQIGSAKSFDKANSQHGYIASASCSNLSITGNMTFTGWLNPATTNTYMQLGGKRGNGSDTYLGYSLCTDTQRRLFWTHNGNQSVTASGTVTTGSKYYCAGVSDISNSKIKCSLNASSYVEASGSTGAATSAPFAIGCDYQLTGDTAGYFFNGMLDEIRMANVARTYGWIATEYANQSAPATFVTEGTETDVGSTGISASKRSINC